MGLVPKAKGKQLHNVDNVNLILSNNNSSGRKVKQILVNPPSPKLHDNQAVTILKINGREVCGALSDFSNRRREKILQTNFKELPVSTRPDNKKKRIQAPKGKNSCTIKGIGQSGENTGKDQFAIANLNSSCKQLFPTTTKCDPPQLSCIDPTNVKKKCSEHKMLGVSRFAGGARGSISNDGGTGKVQEMNKGTGIGVEIITLIKNIPGLKGRIPQIQEFDLLLSSMGELIEVSTTKEGTEQEKFCKNIATVLCAAKIGKWDTLGQRQEYKEIEGG